MRLVVKPGTGRGRPRQTGDRDAGGRLRPPGPNPKVVAERRALVGQDGDIARASSPLDLALARGWISQGQHRAGTNYARLYRMSRLGAPDRDVGFGLREAPGVEAVDPRGLREMSDCEIAAAFDGVFDRVERGDAEARASAAFREWKALNALMSPDEQREVFLVCVRDSWPQWIVQRAAGRFGTRWEAAHGALIAGLNAIDARSRRPRTAAPSQPAAPAPERPPRRTTARRLETTLYIDGEGALLFEVERRGRG